jgi:hypothetical protein
MGYNRSGKRRTERMKRSKRHVERLLRKASAETATPAPASEPAKGAQPTPTPSAP